MNLNQIKATQPNSHKLFTSLSKYPYSIYLLYFTMAMFFLFLLKPEYDRYPSSYYYSQIPSAVFNMMGRQVFISTFGIACIAGLTGKDKYINYILGGKLWMVLGRLTFQVYLIHIPIYHMYFGQIRQAYNLSHMYLVWNWMALTTVSFFLAIPVTVLFEAPFSHFSKLVLMPQKRKMKKAKLDNEREFAGFKYEKIGEELTKED